MKNLVFIILNGAEYGGSEKNVSDIINNLDPNYQITLICSKNNRIVDRLTKNVKIYPMDRGLLSWIKICRFLNKKSPDIVHLHAARAIFMGRVAANLVNFIGKKQIRIVTTVHGLYFSTTKSNFVIRWLFRFLSSKDDCTIAVSKKDKELLIEKYGYNRNVNVIYNGIDTRMFKGISHDTNDLGFIGRLSPQKNPEIMIQLAKSVPENCNINIYGEGPLLSGMKAEAVKNNITNIHFKGFSDDITNAFSNIRILISPSVFEGLPYTYIESLASGIPVICTNVGGVNEIVDDLINGILIDREKDILSQILFAIKKISLDYDNFSRNAQKNLKIFQ
ncbi:glycosyltransferase [Enterococcus sp. DIV1390a]|uniref:glycosyltransferase n=1 Tax=Enterococcus sp. DIV1390a TaxID=2774970 RepID=UPI003F2314AA